MFVSPPVTRREEEYRIPYSSQGCGYALNQGAWTSTPATVMGNCTQQARYALCGVEAVRRWEWGPAAAACQPRHFDAHAGRALLAGKWVAFVGDSIARLLSIAVMEALAAPASAAVFERHADFERNLDSGFKLSFHWRPFPNNATALLAGWGSKARPDLVVMSTALWHMLHVSNAQLYSAQLRGLRAVAAMLVGGSSREQRCMLVGTSATELYPTRMLSTAKRARMTPEAVDAYNRALAESGVLAAEGPFGLLDMFALTHGCGLECSVDGVHSRPPVYATAAQMLLNMVHRCGHNCDECWAR